ncbi:MAG: hypothetical protein HDT46_09245 [Ruminococcaceae bacterium]|nr:hypothetical protein [Oscillospiraceae bacterium]
MTQAQISEIASTVNAASDSIYEALKYVYFVCCDDFYKINVKDVFKIALSNVTDSRILSNLGFKLYPEKIGDLKNPQFEEVKKLISYAFAVRLPFIKKYLPLKSSFTDGDLRDMFKAVCDSGARNIDNIITMDFKTSLKTATKQREQDEPVFETEWFKTWVYAYGKEFAVINNKNMFFLGCADALFALYWAALTDKLVDIVKSSITVY